MANEDRQRTSLDVPARGVTEGVADDQRLVRTGFRVILGDAEGIEVVGEAADGVEAVEQAVALNPDVVLMDIRMPRPDGSRGPSARSGRRRRAYRRG